MICNVIHKASCQEINPFNIFGPENQINHKADKSWTEKNRRTDSEMDWLE